MGSNHSKESLITALGASEAEFLGLHDGFPKIAYVDDLCHRYGIFPENVEEKINSKDAKKSEAYRVLGNNLYRTGDKKFFKEAIVHYNQRFLSGRIVSFLKLLNL